MKVLRTKQASFVYFYHSIISWGNLCLCYFCLVLLIFFLSAWNRGQTHLQLHFTPDVATALILSICLLQVSITSPIRDRISVGMINPNRETFDEAQAHIYDLMRTDAYPRFKNSEVYKKALAQTMPRFDDVRSSSRKFSWTQSLVTQPRNIRLQ